MILSQFEDLLDRHGGNLSDWPADMRREAAALLPASSRASAALRVMNEIEGFLAASRADDLGHDRLAETASRARQARPIPAKTRRAGWAAAAMVMLVAGLVLGDIRPAREDSVDALMTASSLGSTGVTDVD